MITYALIKNIPAFRNYLDDVNTFWELCILFGFYFFSFMIIKCQKHSLSQGILRVSWLLILRKPPDFIFSSLVFGPILYTHRRTYHQFATQTLSEIVNKLRSKSNSSRKTESMKLDAELLFKAASREIIARNLLDTHFDLKDLRTLLVAIAKEDRYRDKLLLCKISQSIQQKIRDFPGLASEIDIPIISSILWAFNRLEYSVEPMILDMFCTEIIGRNLFFEATDTQMANILEAYRPNSKMKYLSIKEPFSMTNVQMPGISTVNIFSNANPIILESNQSSFASGSLNETKCFVSNAAISNTNEILMGHANIPTITTNTNERLFREAIRAFEGRDLFLTTKAYPFSNILLSIAKSCVIDSSFFYSAVNAIKSRNLFSNLTADPISCNEILVDFLHSFALSNSKDVKLFMTAFDFIRKNYLLKSFSYQQLATCVWAFGKSPSYPQDLLVETIAEITRRKGFKYLKPDDISMIFYAMDETRCHRPRFTKSVCSEIKRRNLLSISGRRTIVMILKHLAKSAMIDRVVFELAAKEIKARKLLDSMSKAQLVATSLSMKKADIPLSDWVYISNQ